MRFPAWLLWAAFAWFLIETIVAVAVASWIVNQLTGS